jgi:23S rRNA (pseudouridine1915-N3)-methyltransferase
MKEPHYAGAFDEYMKRLGRYGRAEIVELREQTDKDADVGKRKEARLILERLGRSPDSHVVALDMRGRQASSEEFSGLLKKADVTFVIGGPHGLAQEVLGEADSVLSLSKMTFPHQLARVILMEQIYRGFTILHGEKYHK